MSSIIVVEGCFLFVFYLIGIAIVASLIAVFLQLHLSKSPPFMLVVHLQFLMLYRLVFCLTHNIPEYFEEDVIGHIDLPYAFEKLCSYADQLAWYLVLFSHMLINIYRYLATCRTSFYSRVKSRRSVVMSLALTWIISLLLVAIPAGLQVCCAVVFHYHADGDEIEFENNDEVPTWPLVTHLSNNQTDIFVDPAKHNTTNSTVTIDIAQQESHINVVRNFTMVLEMVCLIFMFLCYWRITKKLKAVQDALSSSSVLNSIVIIARIDRNKREKRMAFQFFVITVIFTVLVLFIFLIQFVDRSSHLISALFLMYGANAFGDAAVIFWFNSRYRKVVKGWFRRETVDDINNMASNQVGAISTHGLGSTSNVNNQLRSAQT